MKQIHIKLEDALHQKIRMFAAVRAITIQQAVILLLESRLNDSRMQAHPFLEKMMEENDDKL